MGKATEFLKEMRSITNQKSPAILTGCALVGLVATVVAMYKAAPKCEKILQEAREQKKKYRDDKATRRELKFDTAKKLVPVMAPTVIMSAATAACILGSNTISSKRIAALSAAYTLSESAVKDLNAKMVEMLGEGKAQTIKEAISKDKLEKDPPKEGDRIIVTGNGDVLCKDLYSGQEFYSNADRIRRAINKASFDCTSYMYVSLNDFYEELGIERRPMGEDLGWNADDLINGTLPITISAQLTKDDRPCICVDYTVAVRHDYRNLH